MWKYKNAFSGQKRGLDNLQEADVERILVLLLSIALSLTSLTKTAVNVNKPDVDEKRSSIQTPPDKSYKFAVTSILFNAFCVIFRLSAAAYLYATVRAWANIVLVAAFVANAALLAAIATSKVTLIILFSALSVFVPNGESIRCPLPFGRKSDFGFRLGSIQGWVSNIALRLEFPFFSRENPRFVDLGY